MHRKPLFGAAIFALAFLYLYWIAGDILHTAGDEGIYLEGGRRVAMGQQPYRDFQTITGPLTFWVEGALGGWSGLSLAWMRIPMVIDTAFLTWAVYWLVSRFTGTFYASGAAITYLAFEAHVRKLVVNHRWDSAALATAAIIAAFSAHQSGSRRWSALSGILLGLAVCATPSLWILGLPLVWWCWRRDVGCAGAFLGGGAVVAGCTGAYLQWQHALVPMIEAMRWTAANYTGANRVAYGYAPMDPASSIGVSYLVALVYAWLPAIVPVGAVAGWAVYLWRRPKSGAAELVPLLACTVALAISAWPRWSSDTLLHTVALSWFLCALLIYRLTTSQQQIWLMGALVLASVSSLASKSLTAFEYLPRETRVGTVRVPPGESEFLGALERWVQPGDSLVSFPYQASLYFFLNARNPTYYSILQPGMMTLQDEQRAVGQMEAAQTRWVIFERWPADVVLHIWPGSDPELIPMNTMNDYLKDHYRAVDTVTGPWGRVIVMERTK